MSQNKKKFLDPTIESNIIYSHLKREVFTAVSNQCFCFYTKNEKVRKLLHECLPASDYTFNFKSDRIEVVLDTVKFTVPEEILEKGKWSLAKVHAVYQFLKRVEHTSVKKDKKKLFKKAIKKIVIEALKVIKIPPVVRTVIYWGIKVFGDKNG